jgi:DNA-binding Lrp family transcriptional regulator
MQLPKRDLLLLCQLRKNSREPLTTMSRETRIPVSTLYDRLRHFEESQVIKKHTSIVNFGIFGYEVRINIMVKVSPSFRKEFKTHLLNHENVNNLYKINNGFDFLIEGVFKSVQEAESFIDNIEENFEFRKLEVYYVTEEIKREGFMANKETLPILYR